MAAIGGTAMHINVTNQPRHVAKYDASGYAHTTVMSAKQGD
jgi:hypothetical protein